jgi:hypothetical protein
MTLREKKWGWMSVAAVALGIAVVLVLWPFDSHTHGAPTYEDLVRANYTVLGPKESRRLILFARGFHSCVIEKGLSLGKPAIHETKITLAIPERTPLKSLMSTTLACADGLGGPPPGASVQTRQRVDNEHAIVIYLPKRCLLDPKMTTNVS